MPKILSDSPLCFYHAWHIISVCNKPLLSRWINESVPDSLMNYFVTGEILCLSFWALAFPSPKKGTCHLLPQSDDNQYKKKANRFKLIGLLNQSQWFFKPMRLCYWVHMNGIGEKGGGQSYVIPYVLILTCFLSRNPLTTAGQVECDARHVLGPKRCLLKFQCAEELPGGLFWNCWLLGICGTCKRSCLRPWPDSLVEASSRYANIEGLISCQGT